MKKLIFMAAIVAFTLSSFTNVVKKPSSKPNAQTYVLVHGAWQAPYAWQFVKRQLEKKGQKVIVVTLPGHAEDTTAPSAVSLDLYRDQVIKAINGTQGQVILVGHSFGGMSISGVAEQIPDRIAKLVYIGAFVPASGQPAVALASTDKNSLLGPSLIPSADQLTMDVKKENIISIFCQDASENVKKMVLDNYRPEAAIPFTNSFTLTQDNFGKVPKYYIHNLKDNNVSYPLQQQMVAAAGITNTYKLDTGHCPFLTAPDKVTALLLSIGK